MPTTAQTIRVPFVNLSLQHRAIKSELLKAVGDVIDSGAFILGEPVQQFEEQFANLCGVRFAIGVNSGTDAILLALRALGIGPGDEVITTPSSFVATGSAIVLAGARAVFVDVRDDYNLDPALIERAITSRTKAVLPVHLTGRPACMGAINRIAENHKLLVIEDAAQAVLAACDGRPVGSLGTVGCFSLHPLKTLNACGDGGVITTNDPQLAGELRILRNIGLKTRDDCVVWSGNSRLDTIQAAMLLVKLRQLAERTEVRRANAAFYSRELTGVAGLQVPLPDLPDEYSVFHTYVVRATRRDELKAFLAKRGIETAIHYPVPIHLHTAAAGMGLTKGAFPQAELQAQQFLSLPVWDGISNEQLRAVVESIQAFYAG